MPTRLARSNGAPTLTTKCTFSAWVKRSDSAVGNSSRDAGIIEVYTGANDYGWIRFDGNDQIQVYARNSSGNLIVADTDAKFRDINSWYHIVATLDSTESTASDRLKLYVNGVRQTFQGSPTYPSGEVWFNRNSATFNIGNSEKYPSNFHFDGQYSHVHFIDGLAYQASTFGSTDSTTGQWKINTNPTVTYGNNGFFLFKDDASLNDDSGNGNNFSAASGSVHKTEDNPSNVFPTLNRLNPQSSGYTFDGLGSLSVTGNTGDAWRTMYATFGARTGKYYWEQKITNFTGVDPHYIGIVSDDQMSNANIDQATTSRGYFYTKTGAKRNNNSQTSYGDSWTTNDIVGVALDLDNSKVFFSKNGVFQNSGDPANGTNPAFSITSGYTYLPATSTYYNLNRYDMNFGNGFFGTSAVSSAGTNASNIGIFEYDVPTGFTALSTKGLNE
tara:strand:+ start:95 stop:1423 length:1329 start_codon:yes stop_codon:yes gene_type:complete